MVFVDWGDDDQTFLVWKFDGDWDAKDIPQALHRVNELASKRDCPIDLIIDLQRASIHRGNVIWMVYTILTSLNSGIETVIAITRNPFWENIYAAVQRIYSSKQLGRFIFVDHSDSAYAIIESNNQRREAGCG